MSRLKPTKDSRTTYDEKTGAIRSFFGSELIAQESEEMRELAPTAKSDDFIEVNRDLFNLENISLRKADVKESSLSRSVHYKQDHNGIPVYGAQIIVSMRKEDGKVTSAVNAIDYQLSKSLTPEKVKINAQDTINHLQEIFKKLFNTVTFSQPKLFVYRHISSPLKRPPRHTPSILIDMHKMGVGKEGEVYLVWRVYMDSYEPDGNWELLVNAVSGDLVAVFNRRDYVTRKANIFWPDPIRSSQNDNLTWTVAESTLNNECREVDLENLDDPINGTYSLNGTWVKSVNINSSSHVPAQTTDQFKYGAKEDNFLDVMAYYYLDRLITYLRAFGITEFNTESAAHPVRVDAVGETGDNSHSGMNSNGDPQITYGTDSNPDVAGGVPDAADPGVIVHEYGHTIQNLLKSKHGGFEEGFNDFLAAAWLDRFNEHQFQREEVMPWDQHTHGTTHWDTEFGHKRRLDLPDRFDAQDYPHSDYYWNGDILATALWDAYLNIGGNSDNPDLRRNAADIMIHMYIEMLLKVTSDSSDSVAHAKDMIKALINVDESYTGGLYRKVIWDAFRRRGLWSDFTPVGNIDLYIQDSDTDTGEHASPQIHWTSPNIWVRNNPPAADPNDPNDPNYAENPDAGHQPPINNVTNYLYVRVHNRGSQEAPANTFSVEAFHCDPATAMMWPTHFNSMGTLPITVPIPANSSVRVGPFPWTPQIVDHECLLAVVKGANDPTIADTVKGEIDHWKLVRFDNNVGQRNVNPKSSTPGGKSKASFVVRGTTHPSINTIKLDANSFPADTNIKVRVARSITDQSASMSGFELNSQNTRWSTLSLTGGTIGIINSFPLDTNEEKNITLEIDFSYQAEHLKRYPLIASQEQDGMIAGQLTIEITAIKESEDYFYGNTRSKELHQFNCVWRESMSPHNQIPFQTIKDALSRGYNGCRYCLPQYSSD